MKLKIEEIRKAYGLTTYQMAEKMAITQASYSRFERAVTKTDLNRLEQFGEVLGLSVVDIITYPEKFVPKQNVVTKKDIPEVTIQLKLSENKRDAVLNTVFGVSGVEIIESI